MASKQWYRDEIERLKFENDAEKGTWHELIKLLLTFLVLITIYYAGEKNSGPSLIFGLVAMVLLAVWLPVYMYTLQKRNEKIKKCYAALLVRNRVRTKNRNR